MPKAIDHLTTSRPDAAPKALSKGEAKRTLPLGDELPAAIARMRQLAGEAGNHLLLGDGPPDPDGVLLDVCSVAADHLRAAEAAYASRKKDLWKTEEDRQRDGALMKQYYEHMALAKSPMCRAAKLRAVTPAGIFAKALVVRLSRTGAAQMAMSLADDMVHCAALRATLWPAGRVQP